MLRLKRWKRGVWFSLLNDFKLLGGLGVENIFLNYVIRFILECFAIIMTEIFPGRTIFYVKNHKTINFDAKGVSKSNHISLEKFREIETIFSYNFNPL